MSYTIEKWKKVLSLRERIDREYETLLFIHHSASNNVHPRDWTTGLLDVGDYSVWSGQIMLPMRLWDMGQAADGGMIKPNDRDVPGLEYVQQWKEEVKKRQPLELRKNFKPIITLWCNQDGGWGGVNADIKFGTLFNGEYDQKELLESVNTLWPTGMDDAHSWYRNMCERHILDMAEFLHALKLWRHYRYVSSSNKPTPFTVSITER